MRMLKRSCCALISAIVIFISLFFTVAAIEEIGQCGNAIQFLFSKYTNTLNLTGSGDTYSYNSSSLSPFCLSDEIEEVIIEDGITSIGSYIFYGCSSFEKITIPESVTSIGEGAFEKCYSLDKITLPSGLDSIGEKAFSDCKSITEIIFMGNIRSISRSAFNNCTELKMIHVNGDLDMLDKSVINSFPEGVNLHGSEFLRKVLDCKSGEAVEGLYCKDCGDFICSELLDLGSGEHSYGKWTTVRSATCTADGLRKKCCKICSDTVTDTINKGHIFASAFTVDKPSSCVKAGSKSRHCTRSGCSARTDVTSVPMLKHTYKTVLTRATLSTDGKTEERCSCGALKPKSTEVIFAPKTFSLSVTNYTYNGKNRTPTLTIKDGKGNKLVKNVDYKISVASERIGVGRYTVKVKLIGKYSGTKNLYFYIKPGKPSEITASSQTTSSLKLTWSAVPGAAGYTVYRYSPYKKSYVKSGTTKGTSLTVKKLYAGTDYTFKVIAYGKTSAGKVYNSDSFAIISSGTKPVAPKFTSFSQTTSSVTVKWSKVKGADGYRIYMYNGKTQKYEKIKTLVGTNHKVLKLNAGTAYKFKIRAYKKSDGVNLWSAESAVFTAATKPDKPRITDIVAGKGKVLISWSNVSGENGYEVYCSDKKDGEYKAIALYKADVLQCFKSNLISGKEYYFKVRAYKLVGGVKIYSSYSSAKSILIK